MSLLVIDASVAAKWYFAEVYSDAAQRALGRGHHLHAPDFILYEIDSIILKHVRRGDIGVPKAEAFRTAFHSVPMQKHSSLSLRDSAFDLAAKTQCGMYDCLYLALAILQNGQVVTADKRNYNILAASPHAPHVLWVEDIP
ncbi:MAG: type II toxin-antitoxin system VapC family toxin [Candidatus Sumerlaeota bacterium]|nr:type II toxin-antitoxin system VapC family toxin [Candidatus Sumerlaeota bacterium]